MASIKRKVLLRYQDLTQTFIQMSSSDKQALVFSIRDLEKKLASSGYDGSRYPTKEQQKMVDRIDFLTSTLEAHFEAEERWREQQRSNGNEYWMRS